MSLRWSFGLLSLQGCAFRCTFHDGQSRSKLIESDGQSATRFPDSELVERNPKLDVDALYRTGSLFMDFTLGVPLAHGDDPGRVGTNLD